MLTKLKKFGLYFLLLPSLILAGCFNGENSTSSSNSTSDISSSSEINYIDYSGDVIVHYYRFDEKYEDWLAWIWPNGSDGGRFTFQPTTETVNNQQWSVISIDLDAPFATQDWNGTANVTVDFSKRTSETLGIIPRDVNGAKDVATDRFIDLTRKSGDNKVHAYIIEGNGDIYYAVEDVPQNKIKAISYASFSMIAIQTFVPMKGVQPSDFSFVCDDTSLNLEIDMTNPQNFIAGTSAALTLLNPINKDYLATTCSVTIKDFGTKDIDATSLYNSTDFNNLFYYDGELGAIISGTSTLFKVWAPTAKHVVLNVYNTGNATETPTQHNMILGEKGVYSTSLPGSLHGKYYTYNVTIGDQTNVDVVDPYALSTSANGQRGLIVDMTSPDVTPSNWDTVTAPSLDKYNDAIIYELHTRDLTMHETWNGSEANRGKYLGLAETGTTYEGKPTGFDYIKQLGVTHVQLLPIYDFKSVDETKLNDPAYQAKEYGGIFNWGYDPQNYNAPEGSYSSDPTNGLVRIKELREVSKTYNNAGIGIIMDVVYNHMPNGADSSFDKIVPNYYFRNNSYSGAGTDTASEKLMFRKFMKDSTAMWADEYKLSGFRFDLMGLHDAKTMNEVVDNLRTVKEDIIVYGEGWDMFNGTPESNLLKSSMASQKQLPSMHEIGAFNDGLRDGTKGNVFDATSQGFIQNPNLTNSTSVKWGILATANSDQINLSYVTGTAFAGQWHASNPGVSINYVEAHDNVTLADKLALSDPGKTVSVYEDMQTLATSIVLLSQGTLFLHAGQEMMRSKKLPDGFTKNEKAICVDVTNECYSGDSYNASDKINAIDWSKTISHNSVVASTKDLITLRNAHPIFRSATFGSDATSLANRLRFISTGSDAVIAYTIAKEAGSTETWSNAFVVHNALETVTSITLPEGTWKLAYNGNVVAGTVLGGTYDVPSYGTIVAYQE